jgi:hypothetical protein
MFGFPTRSTSGLEVDRVFLPRQLIEYLLSLSFLFFILNFSMRFNYLKITADIKKLYLKYTAILENKVKKCILLL